MKFLADQHREFSLKSSSPWWSAGKWSAQAIQICRSCPQALWEELPLVASAPWRHRSGGL